jgi:hypothetical protein
VKTTLAWTALIAPVILFALLTGCGDEKPRDPCAEVPGYQPTTPYVALQSPYNVMKNLQTSWKARDPKGYAGILADDFRFYLSPEAQTPGGATFWTRDQDSTYVARLFVSEEVNDIRVHLMYGNAQRARPRGLVTDRRARSPARSGVRSGRSGR